MNIKNPVVVLELGVNGLGVVRSFAGLGIEIFGVFTEKDVGCFSKYCIPIRFPKIIDKEIVYKDMLVELCSSMPVKPVIFPTSDQTVSLLSDHRKELSEHAIFSLPDKRTLDQIINKDGTFFLASSCNVPIPKTYIPKSKKDIIDISSEINFPVILKPNDTYSQLFPGNAKNFTFNTKEELISFFSEYPDCVDRGVLQEIILSGDGNIYVCAGYFDENGEPLALYSGRKIRQFYPDYGVTCFGESVRVPEIENITVDFMKRIKYRGMCAVEFSKDRRSGEFYFLEINARSYYHNTLFLSCGINLPHIAYSDMISLAKGKKTKPEQVEGIFWVDLRRDIGSFWRKNKKGELDFFSWFLSVVKARSFAVFDIRDLKPSLYNAYIFIKVLVGKATRGF